MFDGLLGRGRFAAKCKSLIKLTKNRIDVIRRKRRATEKFLKRDIADLLANRLDDNAYGRAEGLHVELTMTSCYDYIERSCDFVLKHLSVLQKLSGCPEECREAISSLMFAAARFSDLPELRDLRQIFQERYGNLECYVNQEFAANLNSNVSTLEKKVHLMEDIASEFSVKWDSKAFELRMSKSAAFAHGQSTFKSNRSSLTDYNHPSHGYDATPRGAKHDVLLQKTPEYPNDGHRFQHGKEAAASKQDENHLHPKPKVPVPENGFKPLNSFDKVNPERDRHGNRLPQREVLTSKSDGGNCNEGSILKPTGSSSRDNKEKQSEGGSNLHDNWGNATHLRENEDTTTSRKSPGLTGFHSKHNPDVPFAVNHGGVHDADNERKVKGDETHRLKNYYNNVIPPPYVKPNSKLKNTTPGTNLLSLHADREGTPTYYPPVHEKPAPTYPGVHEKTDAGSSSERIQLGLDNSEQDWQENRHERPGKQKDEAAPNLPISNHKSMRRKHSKSQSEASNEDAEVGRKSRSRLREETRRGLQILFDDKRHKTDDEERIIDTLLIHYSKKPTIPVPEKSRRKSRSRHGHEIDNSNLKNGPDETPGMIPHPPRSASLPHEETGSMEVNKVFNRAASFQPDRSNEARHVHPKLPDYDDLAARMAVLRGL